MEVEAERSGNRILHRISAPLPGSFNRTDAKNGKIWFYKFRSDRLLTEKDLTVQRMEE